MDKINQEKKIIQSIFLVPLFSLSIFAFLLFLSLFFYFHEFKKIEIESYQNFILEERENETKDILLSIVQDINHDLLDLNKNIRLELKERVEEAQKIIDRVIKDNPNKPKKELIELIKQILTAIRYNHSRGYYFAYDKKTSIVLIHPLKKFKNKNMANFKDIKGTYIIKWIDQILKTKDEAYTTIYFAKPSNPNKEYKKIIYVKYLPKLNWVIGTGEYINDALDELKQELLKEITSKRYGKNGYFWIHSVNYKLLAHPYRKKDIGTNDENLTDIKGTKIIQMFVKEAISNPNGTFVTYYWKNPTTNKIEKKISFVYYLPKFQWVIGTGLYLQDINSILNKKTKKIEKEFKKLIIIIIGFLLIISFLVSIISYILSKHTQHIFEIYKEDLENKIQKAVDENTKKDMILQQQSKLAAMGEMISAIAHQWRQPLNTLSLNIQLLIDDFFDNKVDEKYIEKFEEKQLKTINFMSKTIDDFRNFFSHKEKEKFHIKEAINEVIELINAQLKNNNISIEIIGEDFEVYGYKNEFKQVILNLINNSKDSIIESKINGKITIKLQKNKIIITDNGKNIPKKIQNRIFEPYFTTKGAKGTGIGLYMSKMIIEKMGAKIYFKEPKEFIIEGFK